MRCEPLVPQTDVVILPPRPSAGPARADRACASCCRRPLLLLDRSTATRAFLERAFAGPAGQRPQVVMEMSSVEVLKRLVELGFGVSVVPAWAATRESAGPHRWWPAR